jgi:hypothetical protein
VRSYTTRLDERGGRRQRSARRVDGVLFEDDLTADDAGVMGRSAAFARED